MKQAYLLLALVASVTFVACDDGSDVPSSQAQISSVDNTRTFVAPKSTILPLAKAKMYAEASTALLLLAESWVERLESNVPAQEKILILNGFEKAREQVCRKLGLAGIAEFNWITEVALPDPANQPVLEKASIQVLPK